MKFIPIIICLLLVPAFLSAQELNELRIKLNQAKTNTEKIDAYKHLIRHYSDLNIDSMEYYAQTGIDWSLSNSYPLGEGMINAQLCIIDQNQGRVDLAGKRCGNALRVYTAQNYTIGIADANSNLGTIEAGKGNYDNAAKYFITALRLHDSLKDYKGLMITCANLGSLYMQQDDSANASKYLLMAEAASKQIPLMDQTISLYNSIGVMYAARGNSEKALEYFLNNLKISDKPGFVNSHIESLLYLGEFYITAGDISKAAAYLEEGLKIAVANNVPEMQANILLDLASIRKAKDPAGAMDYLVKAKIICRNTQNKFFLTVVYNEIVAIYKQQGNYKDALATLEEKQKLEDSVFNIEKTKEIANISASYHFETNKRINELHTLSKRNALQRDIIVIVAVCLVVVLAVTLFYYRKTRRLNGQLVVHEKQLEELNSMKDKLFSVIGHDLRGPIARIPNIIDIYEDAGTTEEEKKFLLDSLKEHTKASVETFDKLLYWGKSLVKGTSLQQQKMQPKGYIRDSIELRKLKAAEKNITITDHTPADIQVYSDPSIFDFIIRNLLANALKYTYRNGSISINADRDSIPGFTVFSVSDTGVGIEKTALSKIFHSLKTEKGTENEDGHGIGLMLCKEYSLKNGGDIWAESELGKGTTFYFSVKNVS